MGTRLRLAVQKSGRLSQKSIDLLKGCGIHFEMSKGRLICSCEDFPLDLLLVRDDDIPGYIENLACDIGIVGLNEVEEKVFSTGEKYSTEITRRLGFGKCRLSLAVNKGEKVSGIEWFHGKKIASSYPRATKKFLNKRGVKAEIVEIAGSVEIAPGMGFADAISDLVSSGATLHSNGLKETHTIFESESVLIRNEKLSSEKEEILSRLLKRIDGVLKASTSKYIMMNAPKSAIEDIKKVVPGLEEPTIVPLSGADDKVAIHVVAPESVFWETMENLKLAGASSILVVPIEKILD